MHDYCESTGKCKSSQPGLFLLLIFICYLGAFFVQVESVQGKLGFDHENDSASKRMTRDGNGDNTTIPSANTTIIPSANTTIIPSADNTTIPSANTTIIPSANTTIIPSANTTIIPSADNTTIPSANTTIIPSANTTIIPTANTTIIPSADNTTIPTTNVTVEDKIRIADDKVPAIGPFALTDAPPSTDGTIERKAINGEWFILRKSMTWGDALVACEEAVGNLVVLPTEERAQALSKALATSISAQIDVLTYESKLHEVEFGPDRRYWVGLSDLMHEGEWTWATYGLELLYDFWYPGQPDHEKSGKKEHCTSLWNPGYYLKTGINTHQFNDEPCTNKYYPICGTVDPTIEYNKTYLTK